MEEVTELLQDYRRQSENGKKDSFFASFVTNLHVQKCIFAVFHSSKIRENGESITENSSRDKKVNENDEKEDDEKEEDETREKVYEMLFYLYRSSNLIEYQKVVLQYLPSLISRYLTSMNKTSRDVKRLESLLLVIYNNSCNENNGSEFQIPQLNQSSIYHDGSRIEVGQSELMMSGLNSSSSPPPPPPPQQQHQHQPQQQQSPSLLPPPPSSPKKSSSLPSLSSYAHVIQNINGQTKQKVVRSLFRSFNSRLGEYPKFVLKHFCETSIELLQRGYPMRKLQRKKQRRIPMSGPVLLELLHGGYFCAYNDLQRLGSHLVECVYIRGTADANAAVILTATSVKSLLMTTTGGTPHVTTPTFSQIAKNMITNASFRTKKMGDDIPVVDHGESNVVNTSINITTSSGGVVNVTSASSTASSSSSTTQVSTTIVSGDATGDAKNLVTITEESSVDDEASKGHHQQLKEKLIAKLPLKKKLRDKENNSRNSLDDKSVTSIDNNNKEPTSSLSSTSSSSKDVSTKIELKIMKKKHQSSLNNGDVTEVDSLEQVEELIKKKNLPSETITIHSPESGTTLF